MQIYDANYMYVLNYMYANKFANLRMAHVHLQYVLLSVTYFCSYVPYTPRTFSTRTFVLRIFADVHLGCEHSRYVLGSATQAKWALGKYRR